VDEAVTKIEGRRAPPSVRCLDANEVAALLDGTLPEGPRRHAEAHIDQCESCRSLVASLATRLSLMLPKEQSESMAVSHYACGWVSTLHSQGHRNERSLAAGDCIDDYRIERLLGRGGMGEVYLAEDTKLGRQVAIKVVSLHIDTDNALEGFMAEARITAQLNHPHVVTIHRVGEYEGRPYLALEYVQGKSLRRWLSEHRGTALREGLRLVLAIAEALVAAHRRSILHRDLKPENVLIDEDGRVRVVDFGLAVSFATAGDVELDEDNELGVGAFFTGIVGTPRYMAPEQWLEGDQAAGVDIWALGIILYELVTDGLHPTGPSETHRDSLLRLVTVAISDEPLVPPPASADVPAELPTLIAQCLDKDPAKRPTAEEIVTRLSLLLAAPEPPPAWHKRLAVGGALTAAALLVGLTLVLMPKSKDDDRRAPAATEASAATEVPSATATVSESAALPPAPTVAASAEPVASTRAAPAASARPSVPARSKTVRPTVTATTSATAPGDPLDRW